LGLDSSIRFWLFLAVSRYFWWLLFVLQIPVLKSMI
jgi:hypothetical protein